MKRKFLLISTAAVAAVFAISSCQKNNDNKNNDKEEEKTEEKTESKVQYVPMEEIEETYEAMSELLGAGEGTNAGNAEVTELIAGLKSDYLEDASAICNNSNGLETDKSGVAKIDYQYQITDAKGVKVTMDGWIYLPYNADKQEVQSIKGFLVNLYGTRPQGKSSMGSLMDATYSYKAKAAKGYAVVEPEYIGFGNASDRLQTYLCQKEIAANCAEAVYAAINKISSEFSDKLASDYKTVICGYSQGGGNAMSLGRHFTVNATQAQKDLVKLSLTICGDGPYDPYSTFKQWNDQGYMTLSCLFPMVLYGLNEYHSDMFAGTDLQDYFTTEYWESGLPTMILNMTGGMTDCISWDAAHIVEGMKSGIMGSPVSPKLIVAADVLTDGTQKNIAINSALQSEAVCYDWTPTTPVLLFSDQNDDIVPYVNTTLAYEALQQKASSLVTKQEVNTGSHMIAMLYFSSAVDKALKDLK